MKKTVTFSYNIYGGAEHCITYEGDTEKLDIATSSVFYDSLTDAYTLKESINKGETLIFNATPRAIEGLIDIIVCSEYNTNNVLAKTNLESHVGPLDWKIEANRVIEKPLILVRRKSTSSSSYKMLLVKEALMPLKVMIDKKSDTATDVNVSVEGGKPPYNIRITKQGSEEVTETTYYSFSENKKQVAERSFYYDFFKPGKYMVSIIDAMNQSASAQVLVVEDCSSGVCETKLPATEKTLEEALPPVEAEEPAAASAPSTETIASTPSTETVAPVPSTEAIAPKPKAKKKPPTVKPPEALQ